MSFSFMVLLVPALLAQAAPTSSAPAPAAATTSAPTPERIAELAEAVQPRVVEWRRTIHANPELSNREYKTAQLVAGEMRALGLEVHSGVAGTGVIAILRGGRPGRVVGLRADMDALPVAEQTGLPFASTVKGEWEGQQVPVMHACGHDAHTAMLMGAARLLAPMRADLRGTIVFVFQPAEEGPPPGETGGAPEVMKSEIFRDQKIEALFALHVAPGDTGAIYYRSGPALAASDSLTIALRGTQTHASMPWTGIDMASLTADIIQALNQVTARRMNVAKAPTVLTIATIRGGMRANIIPETLDMQGSLRSFDPDMRRQVIEQTEATVASISQRYGATGTVTWGKSNPPTINDETLAQLLRAPLMQATGGKLDSEAGYVMASEDFAHYREAMPILIYNLGIGFPKGANHSPFFDIDEKAMPVGVAAHVLTALTFLNQ